MLHRLRRPPSPSALPRPLGFKTEVLARQPSPWTRRWVLILLIMAPAPGLPGIRCPVLGPVLLFRHRAWFCVLPCLPHRWATAGSKLCSPVLTS